MLEEEKWHVSKSVSISHILTTVAMVACFLVFLDSVDDRIDLNTYRLDTIERSVDEKFKEIKDHLDYIRDRLDEGRS